MKRTAILLGIFCAIMGRGAAQTGITIRGRVEDSAGSALSHATVNLATTTDSLHRITDDDGRFSFSLAWQDSGIFEMSVSITGYLPLKKQFRIGDGDHVLQLKPMVLQKDYRDLQPIVVTRVRPVTIGEDTVDYHVAAFPLRDGSYVEDILKRLPGIEVDAQGNVIFQGKIISKAMVDGKDFFGGNVLIAIRNLPADIVDKIELIDDYGDEARLTGVKSGDPQKVLNIVLKQDRRSGQFGQTQAGFGNLGKYLGTIFANSFSDDRQLSVNGEISNNTEIGNSYVKTLAVHYADSWSKAWNGSGTIGFSGNDQSSSVTTSQNNYLDSSLTSEQQTIATNSHSRNANFAYELKYSPNPSASLRITPFFGLEGSRQGYSNDFAIAMLDSAFSKSSAGNSISNTTSKTLTGGSDFYYEKLLVRSKARFSISGFLHYSGNTQQAGDLTNSVTTADSISSPAVQHYFTSTQSIAWDEGVTGTYFSPMGKTGFLDLGYSWHNLVTRNSKLTTEPDSASLSPIPVDSLSNDYLLRSVTSRLHVGYSAHFPRINLTLGLDAQPASLSGESSGKLATNRYSYFNLLPGAQLSYVFSPHQKLSVNYSSNPVPPSLQQLQPVTDLSNPQYPVTGNPNLRPAFSQDVSVHFEQSFQRGIQYWGFGADLGYSANAHLIIAAISQPRDSTVVIQQTSYLNENGSYLVHANYHVNLPSFLLHRFRIMLSGNFSSAHAPSMTDSIMYKTVSLTWSQNLHLSLILPELLESDLTGYYNLTVTRYSLAGNAPTRPFSAGWSLNSRHYFLHHWTLAYNLAQNYTSGIQRTVQTNPALLNASLERQFLDHNRASLTLSVVDLLNCNAGVNQSVTATTITSTQNSLVGRYFLLTLLLKLNRFRR